MYIDNLFFVLLYHLTQHTARFKHLNKCAVHPRIRKARVSSMTLIHRGGEGGDNNGEFDADGDGGGEVRLHLGPTYSLGSSKSYFSLLLFLSLLPFLIPLFFAFFFFLDTQVFLAHTHVSPSVRR